MSGVGKSIEKVTWWLQWLRGGERCGATCLLFSGRLPGLVYMVMSGSEKEKEGEEEGEKRLHKWSKYVPVEDEEMDFMC